jgi:hypothetical protein
MGRSVSNLHGAQHTTYIHLDGEDEWEFQDILDDVRFAAIKAGIYEADTWEGREDHIIAQGDNIDVAISEYCGLVCISTRDNAEDEETDEDEFTEEEKERIASKAQAIADKIAKMYSGSSLRRIGTFSNGESVYERD